MTSTAATHPIDALRESGRASFLAYALTQHNVLVTSCTRKRNEAGAYFWRYETSRGRYDVPGKLLGATQLDALVEGMLQRGLCWQKPPQAMPMQRTR